MTHRVTPIRKSHLAPDLLGSRSRNAGRANLCRNFVGTVNIARIYFQSLIVVLALIASVDRVSAGTVWLTWHRSSDTKVVGYKIYYGAASHIYTANLAVGNVTNASITGLAEGTTYYFAARSSLAAGDESAFSNETSYQVPNPPPTLDAIAGQNIKENASRQTVHLTGITPGAKEPNQELKITAVSSNPALIPTPAVTYTSPGTTGILSFAPRPNTFGSATITITINNGGAHNNIATQSFTVTVLSPAQPARATLTPQASHARGQFSFTVSGISGSRFVVQASTDLVHWTPVQTNTAPFTLVDTNAGAYPRRFYRAGAAQ